MLSEYKPPESIKNEEVAFRYSFDLQSKLLFFNESAVREMKLQLSPDPEGFCQQLVEASENRPAYARRYIIESVYGRSVSGDGRAGIIGCVRGAAGDYEINLKGAGTNPLTRPGQDGLMSCYEAIRETLGSEYLAAWGVPTTRVLAVFKGPSLLARPFDPSPNPSAMIVRAARSFYRVGNLQHLAIDTNRVNLLEVVKHFNEALDFSAISDERPEFVFVENVIRNTARLLARMTISGFIHGTLNTSHITLSGESIDHGPFAVTDEYHDEAAAHVFDPLNVSSYGQQPKTTFSLLLKLLDVFKNEPTHVLLKEKIKNYKSDLKNEMVRYAMQVSRSQTTNGEEGARLLTEWLTHLRTNKKSMNEFFSRNYPGRLPQLTAEEIKIILAGIEGSEKLDLTQFNKKISKLQSETRIEV